MAEQETPYLYILMRVDLASMNAGKAVAQGAHAANQFIHQSNLRIAEDTNHGIESNLQQLLLDWTNQGVSSAGFGTTITLECKGDHLHRIVNAAKAAGYQAGVVHDPTYPLRDGEVTHLIPLDTCAYVFGTRDKLYAAVPEMATLGLMGVCGMVRDAGFHLNPKQIRDLLRPQLS